MAHGSFAATETNKTLCLRCGSLRQTAYCSSAATVASPIGYLKAAEALMLGLRDQKAMIINGEWVNSILRGSAERRRYESNNKTTDH